jgi:hypothetical protein
MITSIFQSWTYYSWSCSQHFELKNVTFWECICIACAIGNLGWINLHTHGRFQYSYSILLMIGDVFPITKGAATEPRASCALLGVSENSDETPRTWVQGKSKRSSTQMTREETKNLLKTAHTSKVVYLFTRALAPPFIGRRRDFYIPKIPLGPKEYS